MKCTEEEATVTEGEATVTEGEATITRGEATITKVWAGCPARALQCEALIQTGADEAECGVQGFARISRGKVSQVKND
jgi:hypothetical protein